MPINLSQREGGAIRALLFLLMQYRSATDNQDIVSLAKDLVDLNNDANFISWSLESMTRSANTRLREIWQWIFDTYDKWEYTDNNDVTLPVETQALTAAQDTYDLPVDAVAIKHVSILASNGTTWIKLKPWSIQEVREYRDEEEVLKADGQPYAYVPRKRSIQLFPAPNYTQAGGLKIAFDRIPSAFAVSDTTKEPGFAAPFHEALAYGMALDYAKRKRLETTGVLLQDWQEWERRIKEFYKSRYRERFPQTLRNGELKQRYL